MTSFSSSADMLADLRIPFQDVASATDNFADENLIKQGGTAKVYKGKIVHFRRWIDVAVRSALTQHRLSRDEFLEEIKELSGIEHKNIISMVGFCDENGENIIVMEYADKGRLDDYLRDHSTTLSWSRRLEICLGVTRGFDSMNNQVRNKCGTYTYRDINCSNILIDKDGEAKISCFGLTSKNKYGDDMMGYPLGLIFLRLLYGRELAVNINGDEFLAAMAEHNFLKEKLDDSIDPNLRKQIHPLSFSVFLKTAYHCLTNRSVILFSTAYRVDYALRLQLMHENIEKNMAHLKIPLCDIEVATENFSETYLIYANSYENVYKTKLGALDSKSLSTIEGFDKSVVIQHVSSDKVRGTELFFEAFEILTTYKHRNIISLLGLFWEGSDMILVFEYPLKGSLRDYLGSVNKRNSLTWEQRIHICLDIAHGLDCIRNTKTKLLKKQSGVTSASVYLDDKWNPKIVPIYLGESYSNAQKSREGLSFIYSFGVLLFEILFRRLAVDAIKLAEKAKELEHIPQSLFDEETQWEMVNQDSVDAFSKIAYQCLNIAETQAKHLAMEFIINKLQKALKLSHLEHLERLKIPLSEIRLATKDFHMKYKIGSGGYGVVYKAELNIFDSEHSFGIESNNKYTLPRKCKSVAIKRISVRADEQGKEGFLTELNVLSRCDHPNIVSLLGYCDEDSEMILIYEHVPNGSLDDYLSTPNKNKFTWSQRMKMCLDIAYGIGYLHSTTKNKERIIHRDIKSDNILLGNNWEAKIADFGLSKVHPINQLASTIVTNSIAGTNVYMDPKYGRHRMLKKESDIYSFGVVLFEILSGKLAYDYIYTSKDTRGLAPIARKHFKQGTMKELIDLGIIKEVHDVFTNLQIGPGQESLDTFLKIAYQCVAKSQKARPTIEDIIKELQKALNYQECRKDIPKISLKDIKLGTENFSDENCISFEELWKVYSGEIQNDGERTRVFIKRFNKLSKPSEKVFFISEFEILYKYKHENVIGVVGYCVENYEKIIVYEHASNGNLNMHLNKVNLGWIERLKICIDIASGLQYLHEGGTKKMAVVHRDIKSSSILLNGDYKAKIIDFGYSLITPLNKNLVYSGNDFKGRFPYFKDRFFSKESDIYAFGVVLLEILSGRSTNETQKEKVFKSIMKQIVPERHESVFKGIVKQIAPESLATFEKIAHQCLHQRQDRPKASAVVVELQKALEIQEKWVLKLLEDDGKTIQLSKSPSIDSMILLQDVKVEKRNFKLTEDDETTIHLSAPPTLALIEGKRSSTTYMLDGGNGKRTHEMLSAMELSYLNHTSHRWQSLQDSRFQKVAEMFDTTNLMIEIETRTPHFSGHYGVYLVFKFRDSRKFSSQPLMYVNLKYNRGSESLHAYFATLRDDEWMMIELSRIIHHKEDTVYKFILESFSPYYCGDDAIYVAGVEFRAIDDVKNEEIKRLQETHQVSVSNLRVNQVQQLRTSRDDKLSRFRNHDDGEKNIWRSEVNGKKHLMLSAKEVLLGFPNEKLFTSKPSTQSRFEDEIEFLPQQVFRINCTIKSQMLSQDTEYICYLVFKLPEKRDELQCPVKIQDLLHHGYKEAEIVYFISPNPWNIHAITRVPKQREDGWMEVIVWKFNFNDQLENDSIPVNLRLMSYEGSMAGLIICGIEFRPM